MTDRADHLLGALDTILAEIDHERATAQKKIDEARRTVRALLPLVPEDLREALVNRLANALEDRAAPRRTGPPIGSGVRTRAVLEWFATRPRLVVTPEQLHHHLAARSLSPDRKAAARDLGPMARQGVVMREGRGCYRTITDHPRLVAMRAGA